MCKKLISISVRIVLVLSQVSCSFAASQSFTPSGPASLTSFVVVASNEHVTLYRANDGSNVCYISVTSTGRPSTSVLSCAFGTGR